MHPQSSTLTNTMVAWRCRRGMLELDEILIPFFEQKYPSLSQTEQQQFIMLLDNIDPDLCDWFFGFSMPLDSGLINIVNLIRTFISDRVKT
ncbi:succinate dehydrogenase assembly factor 2 [soil metagenome]